MTRETCPAPRLFELQRDVDVTGYSGVGGVADGVIWPDGTVSMRWRGEIRTTTEAACVAHIEAIHGHGGASRVVLVGDVEGVR